VDRVGNRAQVGIRQHQSGCRLDVWRKHQVRLSLPDRGNDFGDRRRCISGLPFRPDGARLQHDRFRRDLSHVENLRPPVAEPSIADHQAFPAGGKLPRHRFHAESAAAGNDDRRRCPVHLLQGRGYIVHHTLESARHVVERAVGKHHRVFEQPLGVDIR
jgi:hypothetical protein